LFKLKMPSSNWIDLVDQNCQPVSNVSLVCRDGVVYTHKIVLASVSGFVKTLLSDIPTGDHVSVFLPDFFNEDVEKILQNIILNKPNVNVDLCNLLQCVADETELLSSRFLSGKTLFKEETKDYYFEDEEDTNGINEGKAAVTPASKGQSEFKSESEPTDETNSNLDVKVETSEYLLTEAEDAISDPTSVSTFPLKKQKKERRKTKFPDLPPLERKKLMNSARNKRWKERNPEAAKICFKREALKIKEKRLKDPEFDAQVRAHQAERKRMCRARQKAAQQLALLEQTLA